MLTLLFSGLVDLPVASDTAGRFDALYSALMLISTVAFVGVVGAAFIFAIKYRRRSANDKTPYIDDNPWIEYGGIFITGIFAALVFFWGYVDYIENIRPKMDEYEINVVGQQWSWQIQYANGKSLVNEIVVPTNRNVKLIMTSKDVLHSFYVPAFRVKQDLVPGMFTVLRFKPTLPGTYHLFCAEYCGNAHSGMIGKVYVLEEQDFYRWEKGLHKIEMSAMEAPKNAAPAAAKTESMAELGKKLFKSKTCSTCHSVNGSRLVGPTFKGIFGSQEALADGTTVLVDENYIRESIMDPMKKVTKGYPPAMPTFRGLLTDAEVNYLIAYIKSLK